MPDRAVFSRRNFCAAAGASLAAARPRRTEAASRSGARFFVAALTPAARNGRFDEGLYRDLLGMLREPGAAGVVVMGTTGEFSSFTVAERRQVLEVAMKARSGLDVFCHAGCANLPDTLELLAHAADAGAEAALVVPPFYYKHLKLDGLERYYAAVLDAARIPVLLYHIPAASGVPISNELVRRLSGHERLYGIKDSSGDAATLLGFLRDFPKLRVFTGSPRLIATALEQGAAGAITGNGNVIPAQTAAVFRAFQSGQGLAEAQARLTQAAAISGGDLATMKFMLGEIGLRATFCRPPLAPLTPAEQAEAKAKVAKLKALC